MRVAFDISRSQVNQTGIGACIKNLQAAFEQIPHPDVEFVYLKPNYIENPGWKNWPRPLARVAAHTALNFWYQIHLPWLLRRLKCDVLFSPDPASPVFAPCPSVILLYDMLVDIYPQYYGRAWRWLYCIFDQNALRRADRIICISQTTQRDLLRRLRVPASKTYVVTIAPDPIFRPLPMHEVAPMLAKYGLVSQNYLLFVGGTNPRKNLTGMLAAFRLINQKWSDLQLVVVGVNAGNKSGSRNEPQKIGNSNWQTDFGIEKNLQNRIVTPGYIEQTELVAFYNGATALIFPSLYEGFGLPPLEAMACGCPVAVANTGALPEVVGQAALQFDPHQPAQIAAQIELLLTNPTLRSQLQLAGFEQIKKFDWPTTARRTLQMLTALC